MVGFPAPGGKSGLRHRLCFLPSAPGVLAANDPITSPWSHEQQGLATVSQLLTFIRVNEKSHYLWLPDCGGGVLWPDVQGLDQEELAGASGATAVLARCFPLLKREHHFNT